MFFGKSFVLLAGLSIGTLLGFSGRLEAADHGDAPIASDDAAADIADVFFFLDPNNNNRIILSVTIRGFIAAGENVNFGKFDHNLLYRFQLEQTGDATPDKFLDVRFSKRVSTAEGQTATVRMPSGDVFTAPVTNSSIAPTANNPVITTSDEDVLFFAGIVDDPFFFDIPAFVRFVASVRAGSPDPTVFDRGRDSFAGYNCMGIALSIPKAQLLGSNGTIVGANFLAMRRTQERNKNGDFTLTGKYRAIDRMGNPAVNVALIPFNKKNSYNSTTTQQDAALKFADEITETLNLFGTNAQNQSALASVAIALGDFLRLDTSIANTGNGGGDNAPAAFPNGRRLKDDTVDILLNIISNNGGLGDNADASDVPPTNTFPFFASPQQPRDTGVTDDNTRN